MRIRERMLEGMVERRLEAELKEARQANDVATVARLEVTLEDEELFYVTCASLVGKMNEYGNWVESVIEFFKYLLENMDEIMGIINMIINLFNAKHKLSTVQLSKLNQAGAAPEEIDINSMGAIGA